MTDGLWGYLKVRKKWWVPPIVLTFGLLLIMIGLVKTSVL